MRKLIVLLLVLVMVTVTNPGVVFGESNINESGCPDSFMLHALMDPDMDHEHQHVGSNSDQNGDGFVCVKHLNNSMIHVHIDNRAR